MRTSNTQLFETGMYANKKRKVAPEDLKLYHDDPLSYKLYRLYRSGAGLQQGEAMLVEVLEAELKNVEDLRERSSLRFSKIQEVEQNFRRVVEEKKNGEYDPNFDLQCNIFFANAREYCYILEMEEAQERRRAE